MIHFFPLFSKTASDTTFGEELRKLGVPHRIFAGKIRLEYSNRLKLLLLGYPQLAWFALTSAWRSMVRSRPRPDAVVVSSDVEVLIFALVRAVLPWRGPGVALQGFIYTDRKSSLLRRVRAWYYGFVLARCECILCHSRLEIGRYTALFPRSAGSFVFVPWGGYIWGRDLPPVADDQPRPFRVVSAGRSGRDYKTLVAALQSEPVELTIICDADAPLSGIREGGNLRILRQCRGGDYVHQLRRADIVAVPLAVHDISAGQMVIIQALAFGKPVVVTRTQTVLEYISDGVEGLLVRPGDPEDMAQAVRRLRADPALRARLGQAGTAAYDNRFSSAVAIRNVVEAVQGGHKPGQQLKQSGPTKA